MGAHDFKHNKLPLFCSKTRDYQYFVPLFARKPENSITSMSAAPKLALVPASHYYCDVNWSYHNVSDKFH